MGQQHSSEEPSEHFFLHLGEISKNQKQIVRAPSFYSSEEYQDSRAKQESKRHNGIENKPVFSRKAYLDAILGKLWGIFSKNRGNSKMSTAICAVKGTERDLFPVSGEHLGIWRMATPNY